MQRGPTQLRFDLFGGLRVRRDEEIVDLGPPKQRTVLALLLLDLDRVVSVDRLVELMWDDDRDGAIASLQAYVSRLRRSLEPDRLPRNPATILLTQPPGYRVSVEPKQVDLHRFEAAVRAGLASVGQGDLADAKSTLDEALAIWSGPLLPELGDLPVVVDAARRADGLRLSAIEAAGQVRLDLGDHTDAATLLEPEAITHPGRERLAAILALAQYRGQRQADALATIRRCRRDLRESSGLAVGAELERLEADILDQAVRLDRPSPPSDRADRETTIAATHHADHTQLVGRDRELEATAKLLDSMAATHGTAVVVSGEPGIGKTSLAGAIIGAASARGWRTAWARCAEHRSNPPLWVATQVAEQLGNDAFDVTVAPPATDGEPAGEGRFQVFRSFIDGLAATDHPLAIAIDDLQWADPDSLRLIEHLAVEVASLQVLLVVTTRPLADDAPSALVDTLAELSRVAGSLQLRLDGLTATDVDEWMARRSDDVAPGVAGLVHERTGGNPLFVKELTELLATDGRLGDETMARAARAIPPAIQFVVRRRVSHLDRSAQRLLSLAAVIGRRFDTDVLADVAQVDPTTVLDDLTPAFEAGLLVGSGTEISFSHALVAEALADEVNAPRRAGIHAAAARCMAARAGAGFGIDAAAIAYHAIEGALAGSGELAVEAGTRAAHQATAQEAHEDAANHWADVARAVATCRPTDVPARICALIEQARSLHRVDMERAAKTPILAAIRFADAAGRVDLMVEAAELLNHANVWTIEQYGTVNEPVVAAIERTLFLLDDADQRRAVLLGALPTELVFADRDRHSSACERAIDAARNVDNPLALVRALNSAMLPKRPDNVALRRARAIEMLAVEDDTGLPPDLAYAAHHHLAETHLELGEFDEAAQQIELGRLALTSTPGSHLHNQYFWFAATLANATGRYDDALRLGNQAYELHRRRRRYDADVLLLSGRAAFTIDRGGIEELVRHAIKAIDVGAYVRSTAEILAFGALEAGLTDLARELTAPFGADTAFPDDYMTLCCGAAALHVRVELGDRDGAAAAAAVVADFPDRWAGAGGSPISLGFIGLALARFHEAEGRDSLADEHFARALTSAERAGAVAWQARTLVHHGAFLLDRGDVSAATKALDAAAVLADRHKLPYVHRRLGLLAR